VKYGVPQGSIRGPLFFLLYINDFSKTVAEMSNPTLFADDTSIIIADPTPTEFKKNINQLLIETNKWFQSNMLYLNYEKTHFMQFLTNKKKEIDIQVSFANRHIISISKTKFLGLTIDTSVFGEEHIKELTSKPNKACYAIRLIKPIVSLKILIMIYFCYVQSAISYGIIFWGSSHHTKGIFTIQKRIIRVIMNMNKRDSCRKIFKDLNIFPLQSQYIFSILIFISKNRELFRFNSEIHGISTRYNSNLHLPSTTLTLFQKGTFYSGSRIFNHLPSNIKDLLYNEKQFKSVLKKYLLQNCFYTVEEYFNADIKKA
jgi:hypothetical protein